MLLKAYGWLEKNLRLLFGLAEKHQKRTFSDKEDSHLTKFTAKYETESVNHL